MGQVHLLMLISGGTPSQVRGERVAGAGDPQHDGRRPLVPAARRDRQHGQGGPVISG